MSDASWPVVVAAVLLVVPILPTWVLAAKGLIGLLRADRPRDGTVRTPGDGMLSPSGLRCVAIRLRATPVLVSSEAAHLRVHGKPIEWMYLVPFRLDGDTGVPSIAARGPVVLRGVRRKCRVAPDQLLGFPEVRASLPDGTLHVLVEEEVVPADASATVFGAVPDEDVTDYRTPAALSPSGRPRWTLVAGSLVGLRARAAASLAVVVAAAVVVVVAVWRVSLSW